MRRATIGMLVVALAVALAACLPGGARTAEPSPLPTSARIVEPSSPPDGSAGTSGSPEGLGGVPDPLRGQQWALDAIRADQAWTSSTGAGVVIAVVDTGVDASNPDLAGRLVTGVDLVDGGDGTVDPFGHGTHVAGIAAAATGNGVGVSGAAPGAQIMPVRVLAADGTGDDDVIAEGIDWAVQHGADVVNLSLGDSGALARLSKNGPLNQAVRRANDAGVVVVAAAGNDGATRQTYRLGVPVIVVNASTPDGTAAEYSNTGDVRAVAAPGTQILSTAPVEPSTLWPDGTDGYGVLDGTSMAAPLVSAVAALLVAQGLDPQEIADRIAQTAAPASGDPALGAGVVDAAAAVGAAAPQASGGGTALGTPDSGRTRPILRVGASPTEPPVPSGTGSLAIDLTAPLTLEAAVPADVTCAQRGARYRAEVSSSAVGQGYALAVTVAVPGSRGAGDYTGTIVVTLTGSGSAVPVAVTAPVNISDSGGSTSLATEHLAGTIAWTCN